MWNPVNAVLRKLRGPRDKTDYSVWRDTDLVRRRGTESPVIKAAFEIPDVKGLYKGGKKTVFVLFPRDVPRTHTELARIWRAIALCCPPMSYGLKGSTT